ncbi:MAG: FxLYD domain-containing protein [Solobacterium sp.]|nr:FxLYD domain-containing protein [Solobacterium sp.]
MKKRLKSYILVFLSLGLIACSSSSNSSSSTEKTDNNTATETPTVEVKEEKKEPVAWEVGDAKALTYVDSIGTKWAQITCPVTNTGEKNLYLSSGTMDLEDSDGKLVDSRSLVSVFPDVLLPGETAYYYEETTLEDNAPDELNVIPHVNVKEAKVECIRLETSDVTIADESYGGVKITGRVENKTDDVAKLVYIVALMFNSDNEMIAQAMSILTDDLPAGDKIGFSMSTFAAPSSVNAAAVDHYEIYAYPMQMQF